MTNATPERVNILNEAAGLITGQRQEDYGTPEVNFQRMADYANIHFAYNLAHNIPISPRQTAEYMILLKMARTINSPTRDSYVDIAGYGGIAGELADLEAAKKEASNAFSKVTTVADFRKANGQKEASNSTGGSWEDATDFHNPDEEVVSHPAVLVSLSNPTNTGSIG
jgi:hypothetical protein